MGHTLSHRRKDETATSIGTAQEYERGYNWVQKYYTVVTGCFFMTA